ncbi:MAG: NIF3-like protein [Patescibacteria group bacterium]|nr:NIF3-like protein [Patescibacteria group bacterium]
MEEFVKLVVFVPETHADIVREAMGKAGAGKVGNYSFCSFSSKGVGRFLPEEGANPAIGEKGRLEEVAEERIEVSCTKAQVKDVVAAIKKAHPYEEVVLDVYTMFVLDTEE